MSDVFRTYPTLRHPYNCFSTKPTHGWGPSQEESFQPLKSLVRSETCMAKCNPEYPTTVSADSSSYGLGAILLQDLLSGARRSVVYASRSSTPTERRYSQSENESLACMWAVPRFHQILRGLFFHMETDYTPLVPLLGKKDLEMLPPRIQRTGIKLMGYQCKMLYAQESF